MQQLFGYYMKQHRTHIVRHTDKHRRIQRNCDQTVHRDPHQVDFTGFDGVLFSKINALWAAVKRPTREELGL